MKTLDQYKNEVSQKHGFKGWTEVLFKCETITKYLILEEAAKLLEKELLIIDPTVEGREAVEFTEWLHENSFFRYRINQWHHDSFPNVLSKHHNKWYATEDLYKEFKKQSKTP
jgi:hypothetical protein